MNDSRPNLTSGLNYAVGKELLLSKSPSPSSAQAGVG
jgi:hypothetical protein